MQAPMGLGKFGMPRHFSAAARLTFVAVALIAAPACQKPTYDNIQLWKTTEKGPGKLADALRDRAVEPKLRAEAAAALVDIGRPEEVEGALAALPAGERYGVLKLLIPIYVMEAKAPSPEKSLAF